MNRKPINPTDTPSRIVWIKAKGGMGNRMLCAASGMLWGDLAERRAFVDWRDAAYSDHHENSIFHFFNPPGVLRDPPETQGVAIRPGIWEGRLDRTLASVFEEDDPRLHRSPLSHRKYSIDVRRVDYSEPIVVFWHYTGRFERLLNQARRHLCLRRGGFQEIVGAAIRRYLPLRPEIADAVERFRADRFGGMTIGVHIRHTDRTSDVGQIERHTRQLAGRIGADTVFLATDNAEIARRFHTGFPRVVESEKWLPTPGQVLHQNPDCADRRRNGVEALIDMYLLSQCNGLVYASRSTFSVLAHCLGRFDPSRVIDVDRLNPRIITRKVARRVLS